MEDSLNKPVLRMTAFLTMLLLLGGLFSMLEWVLLLLSFDTFVRGFTHLPISPLHRAARAQAAMLRRQVKPVDAAPHRFAAKLSFAAFALAALLSFAGFYTPVRGLAELMVLAFGVEAFSGISLGAKIYERLFKSK